jgi:Ran-binding protein 9/10
MDGQDDGREMNGGGAWKRPDSSWSNDFGRETGRMNCPLHDYHPAFVLPSYLRHSRHVQRLKKAWEAHVHELREALKRNPVQIQPSLSASSSHVNLSKVNAQSSYRTPIQDVVFERIPPHIEEERSRPLPTRWNEDDRMTGLEVVGDGDEVRFNIQTKASTDEAASVRADHPMPREAGLYYFEVTVLSKFKDALIGIGFSGRKVNLNRLPGWEADSWAYHGDDGFSFACTASGKAYGPRYGAHDVIGCGVNFRTGVAFFTKNGVHLGM